MKKNFIILAIFIISSYFRVDGEGYSNVYNDLMSKQLTMMPNYLFKELKNKNVIIIDDPLFVGVVTIDGREVSKVVISEKLITDPEKRYLIAHLIRNILIDRAIIYNYPKIGYNFVMHPVVEVDDDFIINNKEMICNVIYYLLHKDYFNLYGNQGSSGEKFFLSPLLASINKEVSQLKTKLLKENALIMIYVPVTEDMIFKETQK
jgi:hypothetical protein